MIRLDGVSVTLHGTTICDRVSATIPSNAITYLAGANGSGKTTLIRAIAGLQRFSGSIRLDAASASRARAPRRVRHTGRTPGPALYVCFDDAPLFPSLSGYANIEMLLGRRLPRDEVAAIAPEIAPHALLAARARALSHGERKRVHVLAALLSGAQHLIFDEAFNGVDAPGLVRIAALLDRLTDTTILLTGHHGDPATALATHRLLLRNGTVVPGRAHGVPA
ncbi:ATP-binding cassette domain-containing protein [Glaciihabitans sp. dw_435]|uniref:ATP-binding cassette domain-containing protein n=1 Tax=Glaciihabitans sp. dw_435 TaxID=2720081 RepID=UPI001BD437A6|nr:ATP-binding cassette domain-containing protein [Glaciihabitans sp. dw_435]